MSLSLTICAVFFFYIVQRGVIIVPSHSIWIVERLGVPHKNLDPGAHLIVPFVDNIVVRLRRGDIGMVYEELTRGSKVQVVWANRIVVAEIDPVEGMLSLAKGTKVEITKVTGTTPFVSPVAAIEHREII